MYNYFLLLPSILWQDFKFNVLFNAISGVIAQWNEMRAESVLEMERVHCNSYNNFEKKRIPEGYKSRYDINIAFCNVQRSLRTGKSVNIELLHEIMPFVTSRSVFVFTLINGKHTVEFSKHSAESLMPSLILDPIISLEHIEDMPLVEYYSSSLPTSELEYVTGEFILTDIVNFGLNALERFNN